MSEAQSSGGTHEVLHDPEEETQHNAAYALLMRAKQAERPGISATDYLLARQIGVIEDVAAALNSIEETLSDLPDSLAEIAKEIDLGTSDLVQAVRES